MADRLVTFGYDTAHMTMNYVVADKARLNGDKPFLHYLEDGRRFSYRDIHLLSNRIANALAARGIAKGDHVAVMMDNCPEQFLAYVALTKLGAVAIPLNTAAKGVLLEYFLQHSDAVAIIAEGGYIPRFSDICAGMTSIRTFIVLPAPGEAIEEDASAWSAEPFDALFEGDDTDIDAGVRCSDLAMLAYTSGTTGPSKGNMLAQATMISYGCSTVQSNGYRDDDIVYVCLPINHANAFLCAMLGALIADGQVALARRFSVRNYWKDIKVSGATITNLLGSMMNFIWSAVERPDDTDNSLRCINVVPLPAFTRAFERRFDLRLISGYGLTDYCLATAFSVLDPVSKMGASGKPRAGVQVRVVDAEDVEMPVGEVGEIVLRTDNPWGASQGYYKNPEATVAAFRNGWWHTGDRGYLDKDGYLFFADRKKDAIRRRGENISSFEVESIFLRHPSIADVAAYAVKGDSEDEVAVSIVLVDGESLSETEIIAYGQENMAYYMVPRYIRVCADMPRTQSQKVEKYKLRAEAEADMALLWDREAAGIKIKR